MTRHPLARLGELMLATVLRPVLGVALQRYLLRQPRPTHDDRATAGGPHPLRVLIVGAGLAVGYGRTATDASLPQQLARALQRELARGVIVECRAQAAVRLERTVELFGMAGAATFDVVIWSPTLQETFRADARSWTRELRRIVSFVEATGTPGVRVVLMGVPGAEGAGVLTRIGGSFAEEVDRRIARVADEFDRAQFVPVPPRRIDSWDTPLFDPEYQRRVVDGLAALLGDQQRRAATRSSPRLRPAMQERVSWKPRDPGRDG